MKKIISYTYSIRLINDECCVTWHTQQDLAESRDPFFAVKRLTTTPQKIGKASPHTDTDNSNDYYWSKDPWLLIDGRILIRDKDNDKNLAIFISSDSQSPPYFFKDAHTYKAAVLALSIKPDPQDEKTPLQSYFYNHKNHLKLNSLALLKRLLIMNDERVEALVTMDPLNEGSLKITPKGYEFFQECLESITSLQIQTTVNVTIHTTIESPRRQGF